MSLTKMKCGLFFYIFVLDFVQSTGQETTCSYNIDQEDGALYWWSFICSNVTIGTLREFTKNPRPGTSIHKDFFRITIQNIELSRLDKELFSNDNTDTWRILSLTIFGSLKSLSRDAFDPPGAWNFDQMGKLNISNNEITSIEGSNFEVLTQLRILDVSYNKLISLGNSGYNLPALEELYVNNNNINELKNYIFEKLTNLQVLNIAFNDIESLINSTFSNLHRLVHLDISYNHLKSINAFAFKDLRNLETLNLTSNKLLNLNSDSFFGLDSLQDLMLTENHIHDIPKGTLQKLPSLKKLQLGINSLCGFRIGTFSNLNELQFLNLSYNAFSRVNVRVLFQLHNLKSLDLDSNFLTNIKYLSLTLHLPNLKNINVNNNEWPCSFLTQMLREFRDRQINYLFDSTTNYTQANNVHGIACYDDLTPCT